MFRRLTTDLPQEEVFPEDLHQLGFKLSGNGQFLTDVPQTPTRKDESGNCRLSEPEYFDFSYSASERTNELRQEAMYACVRRTVSNALKARDVQEIFLDGASPETTGGPTVSDDKPSGKHIAILGTGGLKGLKKKKEIVLVVGESCQDLGIWSYGVILRRTGIMGGSAAGLVSRLSIVRLRPDEKGDDSTSGISDTLKDLKLRPEGNDGVAAAKNKSTANESAQALSSDDTPGVVILNPGQLLWSPSKGITMSTSTWLRRHLPSAISQRYQVDGVQNRINYNRTPAAHIQTCLTLLPDLLHKDCKVFALGITDGCDHMLKFFDHGLKWDGKWISHFDRETFWKKNLMAVALCQPLHHPDDLNNETFKAFLVEKGRSWVIWPRLKKNEEVPTTLSQPSGFGTGENTETSDEDADDSEEVEPSLLEASCPTFSAGNHISRQDLVFPTVIDVVVKFWKLMAGVGEA